MCPPKGIHTLKPSPSKRLGMDPGGGEGQAVGLDLDNPKSIRYKKPVFLYKSS